MSSTILEHAIKNNLLQLVISYDIYNRDINAIIDYMRILAPINSYFKKNIETLQIWGEIIVYKLYSNNIKKYNNYEFYSTKRDNIIFYRYKYFEGFMRSSYSILNNQQKNIFEYIYLKKISGYGFILPGTQYIKFKEYKIFSDNNNIANTLIYLHLPTEPVKLPYRQDIGYCVFIKLIRYNNNDTNNSITIPYKSFADKQHSELYSTRQIIIHPLEFKRIVEHSNVIKF